MMVVSMTTSFIDIEANGLAEVIPKRCHVGRWAINPKEFKLVRQVAQLRADGGTLCSANSVW